MEDNIIEIKNLKKSFDSVIAVDDINLSIKKGEMFGIVGPDGAGKTTMIKMLCGIIKPNNGEGNIFGFNFIDEKDKIKNHIGYLSQKFSLYGDLSIDENIEFFAEIHNIKNYKSRREELLSFTRLKEFRTRLANRLSGGMKQKLALACTLIHTPEIIFLDEPTTGVDPVSRRDFWKILFNLLKSGITIILTTPYLDEAERCSRIGMMDKGKFLVVDKLSEIKKLMNGILIEIVCNKIRYANKILINQPIISQAQTFGDRLNVVIQNENHIEEIKTILKNNDIELLDIRIISPSLENVFISLVNKNQKENR